MVCAAPAFSADGHHSESEEFNAGELIMHHILDTHDWHIMDLTGDDGQKHAVSMPLPIIIWHKGEGLKVFSSSKFHHGTEAYNGYFNNHEHIVFQNADGTINEAETSKLIDLSITKNVVSLFLVAILLILVFTSIGRAYKRNPNGAPKGMQSFFEPIIVFIRDEVAIPIIGHKYQRFMPFLLSVFFFIWFGNMLGLIPIIPGGANMTGNIAIAAVLALISFLIVMINSNKNYWQHILAMPGVPPALYIILTPIEIIGMFLKPMVLMIRLFANITAGHITILAFISLIFIMGSMSPAAGWGTSIISVLLAVIMTFLELLVAFLQAFIFTLLSATYFGAATEEAHH
jgi:F-type H+-transporting ATPase subunit a